MVVAGVDETNGGEMVVAGVNKTNGGDDGCTSE